MKSTITIYINTITEKNKLNFALDKFLIPAKAANPLPNLNQCGDVG